ncbi:hypothetical protein VTN77DRAFT_4167 [Rasamsonia byssochlamydoides]|uniref:uncharacterized protein n=1 Tax=Rasamsonia byssochlamydoides TaxID=89139 RepID=UPI003744A82D
MAAEIAATAARKRPIEPRDIAFLPEELFHMILSYLDPVDVVRCRRVSRSWSDAFANPTSLIRILKRTFPRAREVRKLIKDGAFDNPDVTSESSARFWRKTFDQVTARYHHLARGKPRSVQRFKLCGEFYLGSLQFFQVVPWEYHSSNFPDRGELMFKHAFWTYEDGLVVFPSEEDHSLVLLDLETQETFMVPFILTDKVIRRIRLQDRVLVIEWAEPEAFHWLNDSESVHRHFATSFDLHKYGRGWDIICRNEWKIMFLGHPLGERDRFFSAHSKNYYTIYAWQPNRSLYTADEDAPIESLFVWDISKPSSYRPSLDPTGRMKETIGDDGPSIIARFSFRELGFYSVRQRGSPAIMRLDINSEADTIDITEVTYTGSSLGRNNSSYNPLEWTCRVQTTSIPFIGHGPCWRRDAGVVFPPYRGNSSMEIPPLSLTGHHPWYLGVYEATDADAQVSFCLRYSHSSNTSVLEEERKSSTRRLLVTIRTPLSETTLSDAASAALSEKGKICGDERFVVGESSSGELVVYRF